MNTAFYSLLTLRPDAERVDVLCVGAVVLDTEGHWHVATLPSADKIAAVTGGSSNGRLENLNRNLTQLLSECQSLADARGLLGRMGSLVALHEFEGTFAYDTAAELTRHVDAIMRESVMPPSSQQRQPSVARTGRPRTRALLRKHFEDMGIMGRDAGDIGDHKVVRNFPVSLQHGLTAEFALRNAVMHITETVDFEVSDQSVKNKIYEAQAKCLIMRSARDSFGAETQCYVVVSGGAETHASRSVDLLSSVGHLFAVESGDDMRNYLDRISSAARATGQLGL